MGIGMETPAGKEIYSAKLGHHGRAFLSHLPVAYATWCDTLRGLVSAPVWYSDDSIVLDEFQNEPLQVLLAGRVRYETAHGDPPPYRPAPRGSNVQTQSADTIGTENP